MKLNAILSDGWSVQSFCWMRYGCYCTFWNYIASALSTHTLHMIHLCVYRTYLHTLCIASPYSLHISVYSLCTSLYTLTCVSLILFHLCILSNREQCCPPKCWSTAWPPSTPASCYWEQTQVLCTCTTVTTGNWNTNWHLWGTVSSACYTSSEPQC